MVTEQEIKNRVFTVDFQSPEHSFLVTDSQMRGFDENRRKLASKINEYLLIFEKEHNYSRNRTYEELVDLCCFQRMESLRKTISGTLFFFMHLVRIISIALLMNMKSMCIRRSACDKIIFF